MEDPGGCELPQILCLLRDSLPLDQEELDACFDPDQFARKTNPAQEEAIASQWRRASRANPRLFNGSKFRYAGVARCAEAEARPQLQLGLTSYREHVGTNLRSGQRLLQEAGVAVHGDRQAFLADPLAVGATLLTADNRLVLVRRALWVGEYPGCVDRPGGHAEPDMLPRPDPAAGAGEEPPAEERHRAALSEVFESVRREVRDELGVPLTHLSRAYLAGVLRDRQLGGRPSLEFILRCSLPSGELERVYNEGKHCEADESLGLVLLTRDELFSEERAVFRVPDLAELEVEYPWTSRENGTAAGSGEEDVRDETRTDAPGSDDAVVTVTSTSCDQAVVVNCDASSSHEPAAVEPAATCEAEQHQAPAEDSKAAPPPAAKPRQQPNKKRRRNKKDKRGGAAGRTEAAQQEKKSDDPVPTPAAESIDQTAKVTGPTASDLQCEPNPEAQPTDSGTPNEGQSPAGCQETTHQNPAGDPQTNAATEEAASSAENPVTSSEATATAAKPTASPAKAEASPVAAAAGADASAPEAAAAGADADSGGTEDVVVVQQNGVVLLKSGDEVTEVSMPPASSPSRIETHAEVVNNPEGTETAGEAVEKTPEELDREKKAALWQKMTPGCKASLVLLKATNLKGFVFRF